MIYKKIQLDEKSYLEAYIADQTENYTRDAILVIPGGGYGMVCSQREGEPIALAFMPYGYNAFVLHYSVGDEGKFPDQLIQASLAMKHIRDNSEEYGINKDRVFAVGFSAGGHLAGSLATMWDLPEVYEAVDMQEGYNKPTGAMLIYPVITSDERYAHMGSFENLFKTTDKDVIKKASLEFNVSEKSSPAFIAHAADDDLVRVENALLMAGAYSKFNLPYELHIYPCGLHGFALGNDITKGTVDKWSDSEVAKWVEQAAAWAKRQ